LADVRPGKKNLKTRSGRLKIFGILREEAALQIVTPWYVTHPPSSSLFWISCAEILVQLSVWSRKVGKRKRCGIRRLDAELHWACPGAPQVEKPGSLIGMPCLSDSSWAVATPIFERVWMNR
jgi:hypothetical protein